MPSHMKMFKNVKLLGSQCVLNKVLKNDFMEIPVKAFIFGEDLNTVENQWRKLRLVNWQEEAGKEVLVNTMVFWPAVFKYTDGAGAQLFKELATIVCNDFYVCP